VIVQPSPLLTKPRSTTVRSRRRAVISHRSTRLEIDAAAKLQGRNAASSLSRATLGLRLPSAERLAASEQLSSRVGRALLGGLLERRSSLSGVKFAP
jgi:hypothetical protein